MARKVYHQSVGNPVQLSRLPSERPTLRFPYHPGNAEKDAWFAGRILLLLVVLGIATVANAAFHLGAPNWEHGRLYAWKNFTFAGVAAFLVAKAINQRELHWIGWPLACVAIACVYVNIHVPLHINLILFSAGLGAMAYLVGHHWISYCTASPLDPNAAQFLADPWKGYLACAAVAPLALLVLCSLVPSIPLLLMTVVGFTLAQVALATWVCGPRVVNLGWEVLRSWLTYNRQDVDLPGIFQSPGGSWRTRVSLSGAAVFLCASTSVSCVWEVVVLPMRQGVPLTPMMSSLSIFFPTLSRPSLESLEAALVWVLTLLVPVVFPTLLALVIPILLVLPVLAQASQIPCRDVEPKLWAGLVAQIQKSSDPTEQISLFMGRVLADGSPLMIPRSMLKEHAHFLGDSGSGKTSLGLSPCIEQLIAGEDCSVIVIDLKADSLELLASLEAATQKRASQTGQPIPLKQFSNQKGLSTFAFNPLLQSYWTDLDLYTKADLLCGALGLTYGSDYGEGYFSSANAAVVFHTLKTFPDITSFRELADRVGYVAANAKKRDLNPEIAKAGVHVHTVLDRLGSFEALNVVPAGAHSQEVLDQAIDFRQVFTEPQVHYFHLSATLGPGSSPEIARLVAYSLLAASTQTKRNHQVYLVIDEFQRMVASNIEYMLQLARSMGVGVILANQSMQDLRKSKTNLIPAVEANCRFRQWFAVSAQEDRERLIHSSGETVEYLLSETETPTANGPRISVQTQERIAPRLTANDILLASDHPKQSIVKVSRGAGYAQFGGMPVIVESDFHITQEEYERRKALSWPDPQAGSFIPEKNDGSSSSSKPNSTPEKPVGPEVSMELIGSLQSPTGNWENPYESVGSTESVGTGEPPKRTRKPRTKRSGS